MSLFAAWTTKPGFLKPSKKELRQQSAGSLSKKRKWTPVSNACSSPDTRSLDYPRRRGFGRHQELSRRALPAFCGAYRPDDLPIYQRILSLKTPPNRGRPGHRSGTRELALTPLPYVVVYWVKAEAIEVLHIHHGAQDWR